MTKKANPFRTFSFCVGRFVSIWPLGSCSGTVILLGLCLFIFCTDFWTFYDSYRIGRNYHSPSMVIIYQIIMRCFISSTPVVDQSFLQLILHLRSHHAYWLRYVFCKYRYSIVSSNFKKSNKKCYFKLPHCYNDRLLDFIKIWHVMNQCSGSFQEINKSLKITSIFSSWNPLKKREGFGYWSVTVIKWYGSGIRIRIRIRTKTSRIRNTGLVTVTCIAMKY